MIVTYGKRFDTPHLGCLIGIDKTEGRVRYEKEIAGESCYLNDFYYNGQFVIANIWGTLYAFDPNTGETVWFAGRKCELQ
jgi:outer membrane protein assembly factor BamB